MIFRTTHQLLILPVRSNSAVFVCGQWPLRFYHTISIELSSDLFMDNSRAHIFYQLNIFKPRFLSISYQWSYRSSVGDQTQDYSQIVLKVFLNITIKVLFFYRCPLIQTRFQWQTTQNSTETLCSLHHMFNSGLDII